MRDDEGVGLKLNRPELFLFVFEFIIPGTLAVPYVFFFFLKNQIYLYWGTIRQTSRRLIQNTSYNSESTGKIGIGLG